MKRISGVATAVVVLLGVSSAAAEADKKLGFRPWHGDIGMGIRAGGGARVLDAQLYAGVFLAPPVIVPGWSPFLGAGLCLGAGEVRVDDPRGIDGVVDVNRFAIGPELRFGMARGVKVDAFASTWPHIQFYLSSSLTSVYAGTLSTRLPEAGQAFAYRFGLGMSFPAFWSAINEKDPSSLLVVFVPNSIAFDMEVPLGEADRRRYGVRFGYGI